MPNSRHKPTFHNKDFLAKKNNTPKAIQFTTDFELILLKTEIKTMRTGRKTNFFIHFHCLHQIYKDIQTLVKINLCPAVN